MTNSLRGKQLLLLSTTLLMGFGAHAASAQTTTAQDTTDVSDAQVKEVIIKAERSKAAATTPTKASLDQTEPQSIISRSIIENSISETADYTQIALIAPSVSNPGAVNGAGWGEANKMVIRGFQDGEFNTMYDGIPFGDTNNPTHHTNSYFPASTIGALVVDRGPGEAGDIGQSNYGGNVKMFSNKITSDANTTLRETLGSFGGWQSVAVLQTGKIDELGGLSGFFNIQANGANGEQTYSSLHANNLTAKFALPIGNTWTVTVFATKNYNFSHNTDNSGATLAQVAMYGKDFNLSNDPTKATYYGYNYIIKNTNFEYIKASGDLPWGFKLDNTAYGYFYSNNTFTANDVAHADVLQSVDPKDYAVSYGTYVTNSVVGGAKTASNPNDVIGYNKLNKYHVLGDIAHFTRDFSFGELRAGGWWEAASTNRHTYDYDATLGTNVPDQHEKTICAAYDNTGTCTTNEPTAYSTLYDATSYQEFSSWWQAQYFADFEWKVTDNLTITPGIKQVMMKRTVNAPVLKSPRTPSQNYDTFNKTLNFLTVNYKILKNWSVYGEYATGASLPPIADLYVTDVALNTAEPQTTTNYQLGTVFQSRHIAIDADVYKIDVNNLYTVDPTGQFYYNSGQAHYKGVEGQISYAFDNGLTVFTNGSINKTRDGAGYEIAKAPENTFGTGVLYHMGPLSTSLLYKRTGQQFMKTDPTSYLVKPYDSTDLAVNWDMTQRVRIKFQVSNLFDHRPVTSIKTGKSSNTAIYPNTYFDQYYYQPAQNTQLTLVAKF